MTEIEYGTSRPSTDEFRVMLREAAEQYDPVDKLLELQRELLALEMKHAMTSADFYRRYRAGELGDDLDMIVWAGRYRQYLQLKSAISASLNIVVAAPLTPIPL